MRIINMIRGISVQIAIIILAYEGKYQGLNWQATVGVGSRSFLSKRKERGFCAKKKKEEGYARGQRLSFVQNDNMTNKNEYITDTCCHFY